MLFSKEPSNKRKFYYRNILTSNFDFFSKCLTLKENQKYTKQSISNSNLIINHRKPNQTLHSPRSPVINNLETPRHIRFHTNNSHKLFEQKQISEKISQKQNTERRAPLHKRKIQITETSLQIEDYIELLKNKTSSNIQYKYSDLFKDQSFQTTSLHFKSQNPRKSKEEQRNHLQLLLQCTHAIAKIKDGTNIQTIINQCTHQYPNLSLIIDQFIQDLDVAIQLYSNENQLSLNLLRITGLDYKIFHVLFKPKQEFPQLHYQFKIDENFFQNYKFYKPTKYDIYYRVYGAGELPLEFQEQLGEFNPSIIRHKLKDSDYQAAILIKDQIPSIDQDFVRKIIYYQKNLQLFLKQKSSEVLSSFKEQLNLDEYNNNNILRQSILSKLIDSENLIGNFPHITKSNRYLFEKMELEQQNKVYSQRIKQSKANAI
ncbi:unnamed protein product [Paramecium primaurelia]|uniref:Uncharacterized protein n=1 Tax=Paramecium primaurelia TaxID=5886 RepID=A0A8S1MQ53_PARPR|nr:unnamed protein product [Paramecium primaurelia]